MKYVDLTDMIDYRPYLTHLNEIKHKLPPEARAYATHPAHYDFSSELCVHDYYVGSINILNTPQDEILELEIKLCSMTHELILLYREVYKYRLRLDNFNGSFVMHGSQVIIDEVLPSEIEGVGVTHEIALHYGSVEIECRDFSASWIEVRA